MDSNQIIMQAEIHKNYSNQPEHYEGRSSSMGQRSGKSSILSHYHENHSQQRESSKSNIKHKQLQNSETINWLKKRYMDKAKDDYMVNQDENHQESKEIMGIYKDLTNNSRNVSTEANDSEKKKQQLQVDDVCGYLQKNDINISRKQLADLLNKRQQNQGEINLDDFQRIMMSQTLNEKFKKCLKSQDMQQQIVNKQTKRQNKNQQTNSIDMSSYQNEYLGSLINIQEHTNTIDHSTNSPALKSKLQSRNNKTIEPNPSQQQFDTPFNQKLKNHNQIISNPNFLQNNINSSNNLVQNNNITSSDDLSQPYMAKITVQTENLQRKQNLKNQSLKNLMNNIHFQIKRQKILEQFEKMKVNQKTKTYDKYQMLESLLKLPQYQINKYKMSEPISQITNNNQVQKNEVPLFLTQSGQLDQLQAIKQLDSSRSPKGRRFNLHSQNSHFDIVSQIKSESKQDQRKGKFNNKENLYAYSPKEDEDQEYADSVNEDEEEYEMQMLVQRAKYKAKQQFKNELQKAKKSVMNKLIDEHPRLSTQEEINSKRLSTHIITTQGSNSKQNTYLINNSNQGQKMNTNITNRQIRTNSLMTSNSKLQSEVQYTQNYNQNQIQMFDESNKNNFYKLTKLNPSYTPIKHNLVLLNGNTSTQETCNEGTLKTEEDRNRFMNQNSYQNYNQISNQQFSQLPHIPSNNRTSLDAKDQGTYVGNNYFDNYSNNKRNASINNSVDKSIKNQNIRRKLVSVFSKIHNNISNTNSINSINTFSNNKSYQQDHHVLSSLKNTNEPNVSAFGGQSGARQINLSRDNDHFVNQGSKTLSKNIPIKQINQQIQNRSQKQKNYSFSVFQQASLISQNTIDYSEHRQDHYAPQISKTTQKRYKNDSDQFFNNQYQQQQSYF